MNDAFFYEKQRLRQFYAAPIKMIAKEYGIDKIHLWGKQRARPFVDARSALAQVLRAAPYELSTPTIGKIMARDHTSVLHMLGQTKKGKMYAEKFNRVRPVGCGPGGPDYANETTS